MDDLFEELGFDAFDVGAVLVVDEGLGGEGGGVERDEVFVELG